VDDKASIVWAPEGDTVMNVLGFAVIFCQGKNMGSEMDTQII